MGLMGRTSAREWAAGEFGSAVLGDIRRQRRLIDVAASAAERPSGKVAAVFDEDHEREGAYDLLESRRFSAEAIAASMYAATAERCRGQKAVFVAVDGSALTLTDKGLSKDFGPVGSANRPTRGLRVMSALVVSEDGVPLGLVDQVYWTREETAERSRVAAVRTNQKRPFEEKETFNFLHSAKQAKARLDAIGVDACVVIDREGDNRDLLCGLVEADCRFIVRSTHDRRIVDNEKRHLRELVASTPPLGSYTVELPRTGSRAARTATMQVRAVSTLLDFKYRSPAKPAGRLPITVVHVEETSGSSAPLEWILYTNLTVTTESEARRVIESYRARWRVEEFHRTWKQGDCHVEEAQLRSTEAMKRWAIILAAVAVRIERLKYLARTASDAPATIELTETEIEVLRLKRIAGNPRRARPNKRPTLAEATEWVAQLGGWIRANGPPGSTTIRRGLDRLEPLVQGFELLRLRRRSESRT
jgi:hypothetical protein